MITAPLLRASPSGSGQLSMIIPRYYGLTITYMLSVCRMSVVCQINCVGGIMCGPCASSKSFGGG